MGALGAQAELLRVPLADGTDRDLCERAGMSPDRLGRLRRGRLVAIVASTDRRA
jgi:hypothetical protein